MAVGGKEFRFGQTELNTREIGRMVRLMALVSFELLRKIYSRRRRYL